MTGIEIVIVPPGLIGLVVLVLGRARRNSPALRGLAGMMLLALAVVTSRAQAREDDGTNGRDGATDAGGGSHLYPFRADRLWGYMDETGAVVIEPNWRDAFPFSEGLARVLGGRKFGYIDTSGRLAIPYRFSSGTSFSEGYAVVCVEGKYGYIDRTGEYLVRPRFDRAKGFSEGLACFNIGHWEPLLVYQIEGSPGKWGYIDRRGVTVIRPQFTYAESFSDGLARAAVRGEGIDGKYGFIDKYGRFVLPAGEHVAYTTTSSFREGLAHVSTRSGDAFIDVKGRVVIDLGEEYGSSRGFCEGLAVVRDKRTKLYGFMDKQGTMVVPAKFVNAGAFRSGLATVKTNGHRARGNMRSDDRWGYINKKGEMAIEPRFNETLSFRGALAWVHVGGTPARSVFDKRPVWDGGEWHYVNRKGERVDPRRR
ncbi:MAG: WG repeat-containing protein [Planctomycetota bacterium]